MILVDTHTLLWLYGDESKLSRSASQAIARTDTILISTYSFFEVATLVRRNIIKLNASVFDWIREVLNDERFNEAPITQSAAASAGLLGDAFPGDPADRILYATARDLAIPFVTRDRRMKEFAREMRDVKVIW